MQNTARAAVKRAFRLSLMQNPACCKRRHDTIAHLGKCAIALGRLSLPHGRALEEARLSRLFIMSSHFQFSSDCSDGL